MAKGLTAKYTILQGSYWMSCCATCGYATVFLVAHDFTAAEVGLQLAWANILSTILQPIVASFADKSRRITLRGLVMLTALVALMPALVLFFDPKLMPLTAGLYVIMLTALNVLQPLLNAIGMHFANRGLNFGLARGLGSLCYAVFSTIMGFLVRRFGILVIPLAAVILFALLIAGTTMFHIDRSVDHIETVRAKGPKLGDFIRRYRAFFGVLAGTVLLFAFHCIANTYLFQIVSAVGGDSASMGTTLSIGAICEIPAMVAFTFIIRRINMNALLRLSGLFFVLKALAFLLAGSMTALNFSMILQGLSYALFIPTSVYYANQVTDDKDKVFGQAIMTAALTVGGVIGNLAGGWVYDWLGIRALNMLGLILAILGTIIITFFTSEFATQKLAAVPSASIEE